MDGGRTPGAGLALIRSTRNDQWRPTGGTRVELYGERVDPRAGADYAYGRVSLDLRGCLLLFGSYNVLALHLRGESLLGEEREMPWWELPAIGGRDSLRGYWEGRFRGRRSVIANGEFRYHIIDIPLRFWIVDVKLVIDGSFFADAGRVFTADDDLDGRPRSGWKRTGGFGFRMSLPPRLIGRLDIGFSPEDRFVTYFNFGTVF